MPPSSGCSILPRCAPRPTVSSLPGRSQPAGRTSGPIRLGAFLACRRTAASSAAGAAGAAQDDVVAGDLVAAALLHVAQDALEALVGERLDAAAVVADDVVVVLDRVAHRLEPRHAVAEVDPLDEPRADERVEHAVDGRQPDALAARVEGLVDLLRRDAAVLRVEVADHTHAGAAAAVARRLQLLQRALRPRRAHAFIVTVRQEE